MAFTGYIYLFLLPAFLKLAISQSTSPFDLATKRSDQNSHLARHYTHTASVSQPNAEDLQLLDTVLLASVDGKFHAVDRASGNLLWSMHTDKDSNSSTLTPLVKTKHPDISPDDPLFDERKELYIVEPQSGDIYVLPADADPTAPLAKLPLSIPQLIEMGPIYLPGDEATVFVGKKETTLLVLELETGRITGVINPDAECIWESPHSAEYPSVLDLDELDGTKPTKPKTRTEIYIGRTDYHLQIHTRDEPTQYLTFSAYGPNNVDRARQNSWKKTPDNQYMQVLPNGQVFSFRTPNDTDGKSKSELMWVNQMKETIVAVFDLVQDPSRGTPFILQQPVPRLSQIMPSHTHPPGRSHQAYVGLIEDSLYAMSPENYPLVIFEQTPPRNRYKTIDGPDGNSYKVAEGHETHPDDDRCRTRLCLTGSRELGTSRDIHLIDGPEIPTLGEGDAMSSNASPPAYPTEPAIMTPGFWKSKSYPFLGVLVSSLLAMLFAARWLLAKPIPSSVPENTSVLSEPVLKLDALPQIHPTNEPPSIPEIVPPAPVSEPVYVPPPEAPESPSLVVVPPIPTSDPPATPSTQPDETAEEGEGETENNETEGSGEKKKKNRGRTRAKKRKASAINAAAAANGAGGSGSGGKSSEEFEIVERALEEHLKPLIIEEKPQPVQPPPSTSLVVSEEILGFGSHGTVVYKGAFQGRAVAVKRLLQDFVTLAAREVTLLQESDDHPNVIRYYFQEARNNFLYIALELCPASLADIVERPDIPAFQEIANGFDRSKALIQITQGLRHLHGLKIIHRDIKPPNILVSLPKGKAPGSYRMLISDFGLCKKLEIDETSFLPTAHGAMAAGTVGWRAPEILRGEVKLDELGGGDDASQSSRGTVINGVQPTPNPNRTRLTKAVDIFALGCLYYYTLTTGSHPYGDRYERELNILKDARNLTGLDVFGEEGVEAEDLISKMLDPESSRRPDTTYCLMHPFFWTPARRLTFLQDASDRFEIMNRDPPEEPLVMLEDGAYNVVGNDWHSRLDRTFIENLGKFRKYNGKSVQDLLRALRNKKHHYQDLPDNVKRHLGTLPEGFLRYFTMRFPALFLHVHNVVLRSGLAREPMFKAYFELAEGS
ncbi:hypothetical protein SISNIDRAFT_450770 [Sistotremastrum niveocremeum HHB9708]|uniref:non-specific serine/threonine protein kinase n=1 Tax=Sistotremastrum niveocremeum HHB9708 TaxID=1314777 RepID=A0A164YJN5_9AGAM|nr:hypothetical protein SISNIDRAFT_450770 [Sistotremastrum niveocremeum HHB9708]